MGEVRCWRRYHLPATVSFSALVSASLDGLAPGSFVEMTVSWVSRVGEGVCICS